MRLETEGLALLRSGKILRAEWAFKHQIKTEQEPALVSNAHFELATIYKERAERSTFLSPVFKWLQVRHLQAATQYSAALGPACYALAVHFHTERNLTDALQMASRAVNSESLLLEVLCRDGKTVAPADRAALAGMYCSAAAIAREAGEFATALEFLAAARSRFDHLSEAQKADHATIWSTLCSETYLLLLAEMDWTAIARFLQETLAQGFLAEHDPDLADLLRKLAIVFQRSEEANSMMSAPGHPSIMEFQRRFYRKIGEAKTLDELVALRAEVVEALRSHEINGILRAMAEPIVRHLNSDLEQLTSLTLVELPESPPTLVETSATSGSAPEALKFDPVTRAWWDTAREITQQQAVLLRSIQKIARQTTGLVVENIKMTCERPYTPAIRERVSWFWLLMRRHSIGILVSFVGLGVVLPSALDWHFKGSCAIACAFFGYVLDKPLNGYYERKLLSKFRRHLIVFLGDVCSQVWLNYNGFVERQRRLTENRSATEGLRATVIPENP